MRVRLQIDTELDDAQLPELVEQISEQPVVVVELPQPFGATGGRLVSAQHAGFSGPTVSA